METVLAFFMLVFGLGFFIYSMNLTDSWQRRDRLHDDYRRDLEYNRVLQERREFGFERVEEAIKARSFFRPYKFGK